MIAGPFLLGVLSMMGFGAANFLSGKLSKEFGAFDTAFFDQVFLLLIILIAIPFVGFEGFDLTVFLKLSSVGIFIAVGVHFLMKAYRDGAVSVVSPVSALWAVISSVLSFVLTPESFNNYKLLGLIFSLLGLVFISVNLKKLKETRKFKILAGVKFAILTALLWGFGFFIQSQVSYQQPWFWVSFGQRFWIVVTFLVLAKIINFNVSSSLKKMPWLLFGVVLFDAFAAVSFNLGLTLKNPSIVYILQSLSPAITSILGIVFEKEKLTVNRVVGVILTLVGIVILSAA